MNNGAHDTDWNGTNRSAARIPRMRYLVAEDHEFQRNVLVRMLHSIGAEEVLVAEDGQHALRLLNGGNSAVDIVVSDLEMPGMDGIEFIRHLCEAGRGLSIIVVSSHERSLLDAVENMAAAYGCELLGTIMKPVTMRKLEELVRRCKGASDDKLQSAQSPPPAEFSLEDIRQGLLADQFEPFFQPTVDVVTGKIRGAEALARWRHPKKGVCAPYSFIQVLERHGMVEMLMWRILDKAAVACNQWRAAGLDLTVSVNVSQSSLSELALANQLSELVKSRGLAPQYVILEVTETAATTNVGRVLENLSRLRMKGFGLSIDDYGTGYSSMQQLTRIPFTELKIDKSFVTGAEKHESNRIILESSLQMAKRLGIAAVAEGVESTEDWQLLRKLGCDLAQGYFFARPMPADRFIGWSADWPLLQ
jgi:EAL domain-containing protein (putative c-di-GMP-specific phosphodiesterase class I)/DNA-binding NarL/FixJ family response regulator